jgi:hypothetical protein
METYTITARPPGLTLRMTPDDTCGGDLTLVVHAVRWVGTDQDDGCSMSPVDAPTAEFADGRARLAPNRFTLTPSTIRRGGSPSGSCAEEGATHAGSWSER